MKYFLLLLLFATSVSAQYSLQPPFPNLPAFSRPTEMVIAGDGTDRIFVTEQNGKLYLFHNTSSVSTRKVFLDLSGVVSQNGSETGLLGLAFHPNFKNNGYFYVNYTSSPGGQLTSFISRFKISASNSDTVLNSTEQILLTLAQPYANHNGGHLVFGPDGYLYASFGDGGSGGDPGNRAQNVDTLFGKILRLDVDHEANGKHYAIPPDNPFANFATGHKKEIYSYGMRNTWKFSFDHATGKLWAGDVGQNIYEEIDTISNGGNYGWNIMEGFHCYHGSYDDFSCDSAGFIPPVWEYPHQSGDVSITGGFVYRGTAIPSLMGKYIYGDYGSGRVWALTYNGISPATNALLIDRATPSLTLSSFGEDQNKEIYFVCYGNGKLYKLTSSEPVDTKPPQFTNHLHAGVDTVDVSDNQQGDLGLKSILWKGLNGTDTSKFTVSISPSLAPCNTDNINHTIVAKQNDVAIGGCLQFAFIDCAGNQSFDTLCFEQHFFHFTYSPPFFLGLISIGDSALGEIPFATLPQDEEVFIVDSIYFMSPSSVFRLIGELPTSTSPFSVGNKVIEVQYKPTSLGTDTATIIFHDNNSVDSLHFYKIFGTGFFVKSVPVIQKNEMQLEASPNPFGGNILLKYTLPISEVIKISIYDVLGKEINNLINRAQQIGIYSLDFDGSKLPAGSYILRLENGGKVISRKIIKE